MGNKMNYVNTFYNINPNNFFEELKHRMMTIEEGDRDVIMGIEFDDYDIELQVEGLENNKKIISYYACKVIAYDEIEGAIWVSDDFVDDDRTDIVLSCHTLEEVEKDMMICLENYIK